MKNFLWLLPVLFLASCWQSKSVEVDVHQQIEIDGKALAEIIDSGGKIPAFNQTISLNGIDFESATDQAKKDTTNLPVSIQGGQSNVDSETENAAATQDNSLKDSANDNSADSETTNNTSSVYETSDIVEPKTSITDNDDQDIVWGEMEHSHTQTNGTDGGQSLVMCSGVTEVFEKCSAGGVDIPYHGLDEGRIAYWNMSEYSYDSIVCQLNGTSYTFPVGEGVLKGNCS